MNRIPSPQPLRLTGLALAAMAALSPPLAQAQNTPADANQVQEVTVTATRRAEPLQKVPVAVSVVSGEDAERANRNTLGAIASTVPSVNFRTNASNKDTTLFIRGVGTISTSPGVEPTVSTVVDGVVLARPGQATLDLLDVDRIEVLRGPQGTLFGRNASAGVVSIITKAPAASLERYLDVSYLGGGGETRLRGGISGPLSDSARGSLTALAGKFDGNVKNVFNGETVNGYDKKGLRGRLEIDASSTLKVTLGADYLKSSDTVPTGVVTATSLIAFPSGTVTASPAFAAALLPVVAGPENRQINSNYKTHVDDSNAGASLTLDWKLGGGRTLTSITAYRTWDNDQWQDGDRLAAATSAFPQSHDVGHLQFKQATQELRVASPGGEAFDYVAGLFILQSKNDETYRRDVRRIISATVTQDDNGVADYGTKTRSYALFGEGTLRFTPALRGVMGLRYTDDELEFRHARVSTQAAAFPGVQPAVANTGKTNAHGTTGRIGPQFDFAPNVSGYATYSKGYKGPAFNVFFNMLNRDTLAISPETSDSYELGLKSTLLGQKLRLNVAVFSTKYKNYQANFFDLVGGAVVTRLINAGDVSTKGVEVDFIAKPLDGLTVSGAVANIKAQIDNFNCPVGAAASCQVNGRPLPYSPDWKASLQANYRMPLAGNLGLELGADYTWQSEVQYDIGQFADTIQPAYGIVNASVTLLGPRSTSGAGWRVSLLGKNLANQSYASFLGRGGAFVNRAVPRDDQRYFGINARYDF